MPELRKDPVVDRWVIIATERASRPVDYAPDRGKPRPQGVCPFCPGNEDKTPPAVLAWRGQDRVAIPSSHKDWDLRVVPNKFPALMIEGSLDRAGEGLYDKMNGVGAHEVLIESRHHDQSLGELPVADVERLLWAMRDRILDLAKDKRLRHVVPFKNHGIAAGASQPHPHSQLIALPVVPSAVLESLEGAERHFRQKERCIFCDIVRQELNDGRRLVYQNAHAVVIAPFASRFPFEIQILPRAHVGRFEQSEATTLAGMADAVKVAVRRLSLALEDAPYNLTVRSAPLSQPDLSHYHWHVEIVPTLTKVAGFELGSGCAINPTPPEDAAAFLREISA